MLGDDRSYNAFGNAPAIKFNGNDIIVAIMKNSIILPIDSYWNPNSFITVPLTNAIIDNIPIKIVPQIMNVKILSLLSIQNFFKYFHASP